MSSTTIEEQVVKYLTDAHAIEEQALAQMRAAPRIAKDERLAQVFRDHHAETERHERLVRERLEAHGASPSKLKDAALRTGAVNWSGFFAAQPDTPGKLAAFTFAYEHLEIGGYELLRRVAERAGDLETASVVERIAEQERAAARIIASRFDRAVEASLAAQGVGVA
ncbi:MAG: DUF892 family protein [Thermoleophilaceae bacterium]|nr:DUF892 family protein [Thermoleophilaceae bacterium]